MTDCNDWVEGARTSARPVIVYVDFKSPYAYLAIQPTRDMACDLGIRVDWRPLVLDIASFLGSAKLDRSGKVVEQNRSADQWSGVKYAYFDCRRYANLRGMTVRGTVKIWDTNLAAVGMLWAKQQGDDVLDRYLDGVFQPFWKRELDVENLSAIQAVLEQAGADLSGFSTFATGRGLAVNNTLQRAAFSAGIFGVPSYVVADQLYFGREHLPRVAWHLQGETGPPPDVGYTIGKTSAETAGGGLIGAQTLDVCIDFASPMSYLAVPSVLALAEELDVGIIWHATSGSPLKPLAPDAVRDDRGTWHRHVRADYVARDIRRYSEHELEDIYPDFDRQFANMGLLWLKKTAQYLADDYVREVFACYWRKGQPISELSDIAELMAVVGADPTGFLAYAGSAGLADLGRARQALSDRGLRGTPTFYVDGEPFLGRQHLPLIKRRLTNLGVSDL